jgi:hypothetical protein
MGRKDNYDSLNTKHLLIKKESALKSIKPFYKSINITVDKPIKGNYDNVEKKTF